MMIFSTTQHWNIVVTLFLIVTTLQRCVVRAKNCRWELSHVTYHLIKAVTFNVMLCFLNTWPLKKGFIYLDKNVLNGQLDQHLPFNYFKLSSCKSAPLYVTNQSQHYQCVVTYWGGRYRSIGKKEKWPEKVGRREKVKCCGSREISMSR